MKRFYADKEGRVHIPNAYKNEVTYGENIKALVMVLYGQGVQSLDRIVELIYALTGNVTLLTITETCKRQGKDLINAFKTILSGTSLFA